MNLSDLADLFAPDLSHRIAKTLGLEPVLAMFCRHCPAAWIDWPHEDDDKDLAA